MLSFFGLIHSGQMALNASPTVTLGYGLTTVVLAVLAFRQRSEDGKWDWSPIAGQEGGEA